MADSGSETQWVVIVGTTTYLTQGSYTQESIADFINNGEDVACTTMEPQAYARTAWIVNFSRATAYRPA